MTFLFEIVNAGIRYWKNSFSALMVTWVVAMELYTTSGGMFQNKISFFLFWLTIQSKVNIECMRHVPYTD